MGASTSIELLSLVQIPFALASLFEPEGLFWPAQTIINNNATFDHIIVGGGSVGCVVARRLAEDKNNQVLLAEYGDDPPIPAMVAGLFDLLPGSSVDYDYKSTRDEYAARGQNNYTKITAGKMLGGSDSLNHFLHLRGTAPDYDSWAECSNDTSWKYDNILPYFKKSEQLNDNEIISEYGEYHGTDGPMIISRQLATDKVADLLKSFDEVGNPTVADLNADKYVGYTEPQYMFGDKKRQTPAYSYLKPVKDYSNLYVSKNTRVTRIIFKNNVAVAVEAVYKGKTYTLRARKEIILSAGVFNTPQLLMLSGIGPKEHLESLNITVVKDLPVGHNLVDQVTVPLVYKLKKYLLPNFNVPGYLQDLTQIPYPILVGSVALNKSQTLPDYQTYNFFLSYDRPDYLTLICAPIFGLRNETCDRWQNQVKLRDQLYSLVTLLQPKSRGSVCLGSADPFADPVITTGYFKEDEDLDKMVKYIKDFISVGNTDYFKEIEAELVGLDAPECADKEKDSDEFWKCYILNHAHSPFHLVGTCPMGKVVDGKLQVIGVQKLRVVDASVMPNIPRAAPNAALIMLAEKASDMIKSAN